ncbi:hypothetical protein [Mycobacterium persicum]|nr:hypothetical protein [Mycobacterium persicum]
MTSPSRFPHLVGREPAVVAGGGVARDAGAAVAGACIDILLGA